MLTITPDALTVIRRVTGHPKLEPTSGLRVAARPDPAAPLEVRAVPAARPGDTVVERPGGRLFVDRVAVARLDGRVLDAATDPSGRVQFILRDAA